VVAVALLVMVTVTAQVVAVRVVIEQAQHFFLKMKLTP
jgi:hypothetical protein